MKAVLRAWNISVKTVLEFELDDAATRALIDLFDQPLSPVERQAALVHVLGAGSPKPPRAAALSAHIEQAMIEAVERFPG